MHRSNNSKPKLTDNIKPGQFWQFIDIDCPFKLMQHNFHQCSSSSSLHSPVPSTQAFQTIPLKLKPVRGRLRCMMSMIAAGTGWCYEWSAGRNVQFTAACDFHLSSAQRRKARERKRALRKKSDASFSLCSTS